MQLTGTGGIPVDLGIALDRIIDGEANGAVGDVLYTVAIGAPAGAAWPLASAILPGEGIIIKLDF
jgi:hypothetical protein